MEKKRKTEQKKTKKESIAETLKLPKDILLGCSILSAVGNKELRIENYKGIIEYMDELIVLQGKKEKIMIEGTRLSVDYYSNEDMKIVGNISIIRYL